MSEKDKNLVNFKKESKKSPHHNHKVFMTVGGIVIFIMATVAFILAPTFVGSAKGKDLPPLGVYKGHKIEYKQDSYFANMVSNIGTQYQNQGQKIDTSTHFSIFNQAFNSTVVYYEANDRVEESKYLVTDSEISRNMLPYFYDTNGKYSAKIYKDTPDSDKIKIQKSIKTSLIYQRYISDIFGTNIYSPDKSQYGLKTTQKEMDFVSGMNSKERSFKMASFNTADYPKEEAEKYGKTNIAKFTKYNLLIATLQTQEDADSVYKQITNGTLEFNDAVTQYSSKAYSNENGILSNNYAYQIDSLVTSDTADADITALKTLADGKVSNVIKTSQGYSLFMGAGNPVEPNMSDPTVINDVFKYMTSYEKGEIEDYFVNKAKDLAADALTSSFTSSAKKYNANTNDIPSFAINYANNQLISSIPSDSIPELDGAQSNKDFLEKAFALTKNEISEPIIIGQYIVLLQLDKETTETNINAEQFAMMYPYYTSQFDEKSLSGYVMTNDKLKNDLFSVYLKYFMNNN
jgi:hypothetical protein